MSRWMGYVGMGCSDGDGAESRYVYEFQGWDSSNVIEWPRDARRVYQLPLLNILSLTVYCIVSLEPPWNNLVYH